MLGDYLVEAARRPHDWAVHDCCTFPAGWALTWGLGDPMAAWRGRYASEADAEALIHDAGGLLALWERGAASIGVARVDALQAGDVGVISCFTAEGHTEAGGIWTGKRWALLCPAGLGCVSAEHVAAWGPRHG